MKDDLWKIYSAINDFIKFSDQKASIFITLSIALFTLTLPKLIKYKEFVSAHVIVMVGIIVGLLALSATLMCSVMSIKPRTGKEKPTSLIFFKHIAEKFDNSTDYYNEISQTQNFDEEISQQVWANSKVANKKYKYIYNATKALIVFLVSAGITLIAILY